jgi:ergothioneine biosynthesis protein EgtB
MQLQREQLSKRYIGTRAYTDYLCQPLAIDDYQVQSIVQTSPPKWHIAHMSWFFETFVLKSLKSQYREFHPQYDYIFNSYYYTHGEMYPRPQRSLLSRPTLEEVKEYRAAIDARMLELIETIDEALWEDFQFRVTLGLNHEQQHQELLLMDVKHNLSMNPLNPAYREDLKIAHKASEGSIRDMKWVEFCAGLVETGFEGEGFAFDNESPRHEVMTRGYQLADRFITNAEYLEFVQDGGYSSPEHWLSDGWALIQQEKWEHPLYWEQRDGDWFEFTLGGRSSLNAHVPVSHLSYYEADAYASWAGKRLPREYELEHALESNPVRGNFADTEIFHPRQAGAEAQWYGDLWAWTSSPYSAYPGFKPMRGTIGEYNGKFMANQMVLKGGSCVTFQDHIRASYRNFFYPHERWAFTGLRLAADLS